jgi:two-component system sensor histidine kinase PilS (NtrC family)
MAVAGGGSLLMAGPASVAPWGDLQAPMSEGSAFVRLWLGFTTARVAIAMALLGLMGAIRTLGPPTASGVWLVGLCSVYLAATLAVRLWVRPLPRGMSFHLQWLLTIGIDLLMFATLQHLQAGGVNYSPLFALPVLMASVLGAAALAYGTAGVVTLLLFADAWHITRGVPADTTSRLMQAGLAGIGYFALAFLANQLALRLAGEERAAQRGRKAARIQAQVNELVIETLSSGVLVVDSRGEVHAANPAARLLLGWTAPEPMRAFQLAEHPAWMPLVELADLTFARHESQSAEIGLTGDSGPERRVIVRTRLTVTHGAQADSLCVLFLEDLRETEARLRTEKLAAMGRMSAAVAHEIRNPLAAITQANALLEEDLVDPQQRQLSALVRQNAQRLAQIVDEILNIFRVQRQGAIHTPPQLALDDVAHTVCGDWARQNDAGARLEVSCGAADTRVGFDADHLRRVLVNLLDNALRYASAQPGSIHVATFAGEHAALQVWSDGPPLEATVQRHLFEPFSSSESRSSGLGLYICRELCERHGAQISYRRGLSPSIPPREGNAFLVSFRTSTTSLPAQLALTQ